VGDTPQRDNQVKKRVVEDNVENITRSEKNYKPFFLENDHPGRDI